MEAFSGGVRSVLIVPDRVPLYDVMAIKRAADKYGASFIGPNTLGVLNPGEALVGMIGEMHLPREHGSKKVLSALHPEAVGLQHQQHIILIKPG